MNASNPTIETLQARADAARAKVQHLAENPDDFDHVAFASQAQAVAFYQNVAAESERAVRREKEQAEREAVRRLSEQKRHEATRAAYDVAFAAIEAALPDNFVLRGGTVYPAQAKGALQAIGWIDLEFGGYTYENPTPTRLLVACHGERKSFPRRKDGSFSYAKAIAHIVEQVQFDAAKKAGQIERATRDAALKALAEAALPGWEVTVHSGTATCRLYEGPAEPRWNRKQVAEVAISKAWPEDGSFNVLIQTPLKAQDAAGIAAIAGLATGTSVPTPLLPALSEIEAANANARDAQIARCLATSPRFQDMTVREALAEMEKNGTGFAPAPTGQAD